MPGPPSRRLMTSEQCLQVLASHPEPLFHRQIMDALAERGQRVHPTGLGKMLRELESFGYSSGDLAQELRHGRTVRYTISHDSVAAVLEAARGALDPGQ